jgi:hypothetical protein
VQHTEELKESTPPKTSKGKGRGRASKTDKDAPAPDVHESGPATEAAKTAEPKPRMAKVTSTDTSAKPMHDATQAQLAPPVVAKRKKSVQESEAETTSTKTQEETVAVPDAKRRKVSRTQPKQDATPAKEIPADVDVASPAPPVKDTEELKDSTPPKTSKGKGKGARSKTEKTAQVQPEAKIASSEVLPQTSGATAVTAATTKTMPAARPRGKHSMTTETSAELDATVLQEAGTHGLAGALRNLAARPEIIKLEMPTQRLLDALRKSGGLVHPAKAILLDEQ